MKKNDFLDYLELFFSSYVFLQRGLSPNTVSSYSDSFLIFFRFCQNERGIRPDKLTFRLIDKLLIIGFCDWLETSSNCSTATRNQRLTAIHSLFRYIQGESPEQIALCRDILSIHMKKTKQKPPKYLSTQAVQAILSGPDPYTMNGIRELAILSILYDSAIRVQELLDLKAADVSLSRQSVIYVRGKGNKSRTVPISPATSDILALYMKKYNINDKSAHLFKNRSGIQLTRVGINYILNKYVSTVKKSNPELITIKTSPHVLRHSKSTHLLAAGVNLIYIRDLLGHSSITTTEIYARSNPEFLRKAIEKTAENITPINQETSNSGNEKLVEFLKKYRV